MKRGDPGGSCTRELGFADRAPKLSNGIETKSGTERTAGIEPTCQGLEDLALTMSTFASEVVVGRSGVEPDPSGLKGPCSTGEPTTRSEPPPRIELGRPGYQPGQRASDARAASDDGGGAG